jgi:pantetheine-phosphate adenylyltransferase
MREASELLRGLRTGVAGQPHSPFFLVIAPFVTHYKAMRTAIYPGSFDPFTNGHLDVVQRASRLFDRVIVAVAKSDGKHPLFLIEERKSLVEQSIRGMRNVEADTFDGLLVNYVEKHSAQAVLRGLRAVSDFEFEFQMALMNRKLNDSFETIFMMPKDTYTFLSSRIVKEIARLGGDVKQFVPDHVQAALSVKLGLKKIKSLQKA